MGNAWKRSSDLASETKWRCWTEQLVGVREVKLTRSSLEHRRICNYEVENLEALTDLRDDAWLEFDMRGTATGLRIKDDCRCLVSPASPGHGLPGEPSSSGHRSFKAGKAERERADQIFEVVDADPSGRSKKPGAWRTGTRAQAARRVSWSGGEGPSIERCLLAVDVTNGEVLAFDEEAFVPTQTDGHGQS